MLSIECLRVHRDGETRNPVDFEQFERKKHPNRMHRHLYAVYRSLG